VRLACHDSAWIDAPAPLLFRNVDS
jgi:hypothetical protein